MKKYFSVILTVFMCTGCSLTYEPTVPADYKGKTATLNDTFNRTGRGSGHFFVVSSIDNKRTLNGFGRSSSQSLGRNNILVPTSMTRQVPAQPLKLELYARSFYPAPIIGIFNSDGFYSVSAEVEFTPQADQTYLITGKIDDEFTSIWIEDKNGYVVSTITRRKNSNKLIKKSKLLVNPSDIISQTLTREQYFLNLKTGESADFVIEKLGKPDSVSYLDKSFVSGRPASVVYEYYDLGKLTFDYFERRPGFIIEIDTILAKDFSAAWVNIQLQANDGILLRELATRLYNYNVKDPEILDLVANKIWTIRTTRDEYMLDAASWMCKILMQSQNPRYMSLLNRLLNDQDVDSKLSKQAQLALNELNNDQVEQFMP